MLRVENEQSGPVLPFIGERWREVQTSPIDTETLRMPGEFRMTHPVSDDYGVCAARGAAME
tara:strand:- start:420 stop:602 length:183 start_codon:yes stop_codon:yes gene_type:complete